MKIPNDVKNCLNCIGILSVFTVGFFWIKHYCAVNGIDPEQFIDMSLGSVNTINTVRKEYIKIEGEVK